MPDSAPHFSIIVPAGGAPRFAAPEETDALRAAGKFHITHYSQGRFYADIYWTRARIPSDDQAIAALIDGVRAG